MVDTQDRPNIIFIVTDDQRANALGYAGNDIIQTPEMDKLAREGTYFRNAFVTTPICAASRASIMTGLYERSHGYTFTKPPLKQEYIKNSYFALLQEAGYHNGFIGKFGVKFENNLDSSLFDVYHSESQGAYYMMGDSMSKDHLTDRIGQKAIDFIAGAPQDRPFCLSLSFWAPHAVDPAPEQYVWPKRHDNLYTDITIPEPEMSSDKDFEKLPHAVKVGFNRTRWKWRFDNPEKYQQMVKGYYRMLTAIDDNIGRIRKALAENGMAENTVIILIGDNGYFLGERQMAGKWLMYDLSLKVPLIIHNPLAQSPTEVSDMVLNLDVTPTILDFANVDVPSSYHGYSLRAYTNSSRQDPDARESFLCEHLWDFEHIPPSEGIRTDEFKYFRYINNPEIEELYDLKNDPKEGTNLVGDEEYSKILASLREECNRKVNILMKNP